MAERRFVADWLSGVGPGFVHLQLGVRVVFADGAFALHLGLFFGELMLQWNYGDAEEKSDD